MLTRFCVGLEGFVFRSSFRHDTNFEMIYFLFHLQRFLFRLSFSQLFCSVILSFLSFSAHPVLTVPSCPGCHALAVLSRLSYTGCAVPGVLYLLSCPGCRILAALSRLSYTGCPVPAVLYWLPCPGCPILSVLVLLSFTGCPALAVFS
jgi:hypothetical protein